MSEEKKTLVTPTGRIVFIKNLFEPNSKGKYTATLLFDKNEQDLKTLKELMLETARSKFDEKTIKSKKFKWGMKSPDEEAIEDYDFFDEDTVILNTSTKFEIDVKGPNRGPDGKFETLIDGDIKAGDHCRFLISCYAWENNEEGKNFGVSFNIIAVQMVKQGEALYARRPSDDFFGEVEFDVDPDAATESSEDVSEEAPEGESAFDF